METLTWLSLAQRRVTLGGEQFLLGDRDVWSGMSSISGTCRWRAALDRAPD